MKDKMIHKVKPGTAKYDEGYRFYFYKKGRIIGTR
jgi:hypothetical protein